jgi:hypothetical protein
LDVLIVGKTMGRRKLSMRKRWGVSPVTTKLSGSPIVKLLGVSLAPILSRLSMKT